MSADEGQDADERRGKGGGGDKTQDTKIICDLNKEVCYDCAI